jgi:hypothetical protein
VKIACLDFETANHSPTSICAAGVAVFESGELCQARHWQHAAAFGLSPGSLSAESGYLPCKGQRKKRGT